MASMLMGKNGIQKFLGEVLCRGLQNRKKIYGNVRERSVKMLPPSTSIAVRNLFVS